MSRFATYVITVLAAFAAMPAGAQSPQGTIQGQVSDVSGAAVPAAKVVITNQETQISRVAIATEAGDYTAPFLPVGVYMVSIEASGFKKLVKQDIRLATGQTVRVDLPLEVGDVATAVTVSGGGMQLVETDKPTLFNVLTSRQLNDLPSNRYFMDFMRATTGVSGTMLTVINGGQRLTVNFVMDGVSIKDRVRGEYTAEVGVGPSIESLEEVNIKTSTMGTDTGLGTSEIHLSTKAGTNQFHGSLYEYYRGNFAEARNRFNATNKIPRTVRNQFGGSLGGPVIKDRTFFFFNIEDLEQRNGDLRRITVPTARMRAGDFSEYPGVVLRDIDSGTTVATQTPFPNNIIPENRIDPAAKNILDFFNYPVANLPGITNNYQTSLVGPKYTRQFTIRGDHRVGDKDTLNGRVWKAWIKSAVPQGYDMQSTVANIAYNPIQLNGTWVRIITPRMTNEARFGVLDFPRAIYPTDHEGDVFQALGIQGVNVVAPEIQKYGPQFSFGGIGGIQSVGENQVFPQVLGTRTYTFNDTVSLVHSRHSLRFGLQFLFGQFPFFSTGFTRGLVTYTGSQNPVSSGLAFSDFLLGAPATSLLADPHPVRDLRENNYGFFVIDDWKVSPKLTLNLGLRYEYLSPLTEANDVGLAGFDRASRSVVINAPSLPAGMASRIGTGAGVPVVTSESLGLGRSLQMADQNNIAPRIGFAYRPFGDTRTVVRGGYGVFYNDTCVLFTARQTYNAPWTFSKSFISDVTMRLKTTTPFLAGSLQAPSFTNFDRDIRSQYSQQWNLTVERELFPGTLVRLGYVGSKGSKLWVTQNINQVTDVFRSSAGALVRVFPYPELTGLTNWGSIGNSIYHSGQLEVRRRFAHGLQIEGSWVWAKHIDDDTDSGLPQNSLDLRAERSDSLYTNRHVVNISGTYELPFGRGRRFLGNSNRAVDAILGGWKVGGLQQWFSGRFITPSFTNPIGVGGTRPDRVIGQSITENVPLGLHFNPAAFVAPVISADAPRLVFGNSSRNLIPTPNQYILNLALSKSFRITESHALTIRAEAFNAPNNVNLGLPNANISDQVNVGRIFSSGAARYFQWSARYDF